MNNFTSNKIDCATLKWMRHLLPSNALSTTLTDMLVERKGSAVSAKNFGG